MQEFNKPFLFTTLILTSLSSYGALALPTPNTWCPTPLLPRVSITGLTGDETTGALDAMVPMLGNVDSMLYGDAQGKVGNDHAWFGSLGAGYRQAVNPSDILGAYIFVDRNVTADKNTFWVLSPGVESMGYLWDVRANGYFPISSKQVFDHSAWGDELGLSQYVTFSGHQQFDRLFNFYEEVGPGADGEIGRIFPCLNRLAVYGGGYFFNLRDASNIKGIEGRIEYPINRYFTAMVNDTYDNQQHNTIMAGVRVSIGKPKVCPGSFDIHQRMLDPIERGLGTLNTGSNIPSVKVRDNGRNLLQRDNIWFFTQNGAAVGSPAVLGCGTAEHPCFGSQFTQANVDEINAQAPNANFYFNSGKYPLSGTGRIALNNGQSIYGRTPDYKMAAQGSARPVFNGGFDLEQGNNTLDSFQLFNNGGSQPTAIDITNANNILLKNLLIGSNDTQGGYVTAVTVHQSQNINITNSTINAFEQDPTVGANATGIQEDTDSSLTINHSNINATANAVGVGGAPVVSGAIGIRVGVNSLLNIVNNTTVNANGNVSGTGGAFSTNAIGLLVSQGSAANVRGSTINARGNATGVSDTLSSASTGVAVSENSHVNFTDSEINASARTIADGNNSASSFAQGIFAGEVSNVEMNNSKVNASATSQGSASVALISNSYGIDASNSVTLELNKTTVNSVANAIGSANNIESRVWGLNTANDVTANITHSTINAFGNSLDTSGTAFSVSTTAFGVDAFQSDLLINNSQVNASAHGLAMSANANLSNVSVGLNATQSALTFNDSQGQANSFGFGQAQMMNSSAIGLFADTNSFVSVTGSSIDANAWALGTAGLINSTATGIDGQSASDFNVVNSTIDANAVAIGNQFDDLDARATGISLQEADLTLTNSRVAANVLAAGFGAPTSDLTGQALGIGAGLSNVNIDNSNISATENSIGQAQSIVSVATGIDVANSSLAVIDSAVDSKATAIGATNPGGQILVEGAGIRAFTSDVGLQNSTVNSVSTVLGVSDGFIQATAAGVQISSGQLTVENSDISSTVFAFAKAGQQIFTESDGLVSEDSDVLINNSNIRSFNFTVGSSPFIFNFANGIFAVNDSTVNINNSVIAGNAITLGDGTATQQFTGADGIFAANSTVNVARSFIEAGAFSNFGGVGALGIETFGSTINAQDNTFLVIAAGPAGNVNAEGIADLGGSTITDINNNYYVFPIEFANNNWAV